MKKMIGTVLLKKYLGWLQRGTSIKKVSFYNIEIGLQKCYFFSSIHYKILIAQNLSNDVGKTNYKVSVQEI